jgi:hypothetical protein
MDLATNTPATAPVGASSTPFATRHFWRAFAWAAGACVLVWVVNGLFCLLHAPSLGGAPVHAAIAVLWATKVAIAWAPIVVASLAVLGSTQAAGHGGWRLAATRGAGLLALGGTCVVLEWVLGGVGVAASLLQEAPGLAWLAYERAPLVMLVVGAVTLLPSVLALQRAAPDCVPGAQTDGLHLKDVDASEVDQRPTASELVIVGTQQGRRVLQPAEIERIESLENYARVHTGEGREYLIRETMTSLAQRLSPLGFVRIHRCTIVNRRAIVALRPGLTLLLRSGHVARVGRVYRQELAERARGSDAGSA